MRKTVVKNRSIVRIIYFLLVLAFSASAQNLYDASVLREFRVRFPQTDWKNLLAQNEKTEIDIPATLIVGTTQLDSVGIRYKGHSSANIPGEKKPFNITTDSYRKDQKLWGYTTINLNNFFKDPTFVREIIAYHIAEMYLPAAKTAFVKLYLNDEYWGMYLNVQQLNKIFLKEFFGTSDGNHYKGDPKGDLAWLGTDTMRYKAAYELKTNEDINDWIDLVSFIDKLNNLPANQFPTEIQKIFNVDRALWYIAFCNLFVNLDSYIGSGHNHYIYHYPVDTRLHIMPWDLNEVLGTFATGPMTIQDRERLPINYNQTNPQRPLIGKLLAVPEFYARYIAHFRTMMQEVFTESYWNPLIQSYQNLIRADVAADSKKLYSMDWFTTNVTSNVQAPGPQGNIIPGLLSLINNRRAYLQSLPELSTLQPTILPPTISPQQPKTSDAPSVRVEVTNASTVNLWTSIDGKAFSKTLMTSAGGSTYQATIAKQIAGTRVWYYIEALTAQNVAKYFPERAEKEFLQYTVVHDQQNPIVINEVMSSNSKTIRDPQNEYDDWIELYNISGDPVNIGGLFITDEKKAPTKWRIPDNTRIDAFGYLLIWADDDSLDAPGLHTNFKLSKTGEKVFLFDRTQSGNLLLDSTSYQGGLGEQTWGRYPNGSGAFRILPIPTPNSINVLTTSVTDNVMTPITLTLSPQPVHRSPLFITLSLPSREQFRIRIFNCLGSEVHTIDSHFFEAGTHILPVQLSGQHAGLYWCRMESASIIITKPFLLVK